MTIYFMVLAATCCLIASRSLITRDGLGTIINSKVQLQKSLLLIISFLILLFVSAFRYRVGGDYNNYEETFLYPHNAGARHMGWGYRYLNLLVSSFTSNPQAIFIVTSLITLSLFFISIVKDSSNSMLSMYLFISIGYYFSSMNIIRQYIAVAIIFYFTKDLWKNNIIKYILAILIASLFHKAVLIMIPVGILCRLRLKKSIYIIIFVFAGVLSIFRGFVLTMVYKIYPVYKDSKMAVAETLKLSESAFYIAIFGFALIFGMIYYKYIVETKKGVVLFNHIFYAFLAYAFYHYIPALNRIIIFLDIQIIMFLPYIICKMKPLPLKYLYTMTVLLFFGAFFVFSIGFINRFNVLPYQTYWQR